MRDDDIEAFYEALRRNSRGACGLAVVDVRGKAMEVWEYHTLGDAENEEIIEALSDSLLWDALLERMDAGGHFYFAANPNREEVLARVKRGALPDEAKLLLAGGKQKVG